MAAMESGDCDIRPGDTIRIINEMKWGDTILPDGMEFRVRIVNKAGIAAVNDRIFYVFYHGDFVLVKKLIEKTPHISGSLI